MSHHVFMATLFVWMPASVGVCENSVIWANLGGKYCYKQTANISHAANCKCAILLNFIKWSLQNVHIFIWFLMPSSWLWLKLSYVLSKCPLTNGSVAQFGALSGAHTSKYLWTCVCGRESIKQNQFLFHSFAHHTPHAAFVWFVLIKR